MSDSFKSTQHPTCDRNFTFIWADHCHGVGFLRAMIWFGQKIDAEQWYAHCVQCCFVQRINKCGSSLKVVINTQLKI